MHRKQAFLVRKPHKVCCCYYPTIAAALSEEMATLEEVNEPYLLQLGLIERTPRGRLATSRAYEHLGFELPEDINPRLL